MSENELYDLNLILLLLNMKAWKLDFSDVKHIQVDEKAVMKSCVRVN